MMLILSAGVVLAAVWVYSRWLAHEDRKDAAKYARIVQANSESVDWPRPLGSHRTPWRDKRKEMAS